MPMSLPAVASMIGARHQLLRGVPLLHQPVEHDLVLGRILGVRAVLRVPRAAREVRRLRMHARQRAIGNAVTVLVEVAIELLELRDLLLAQHLAAIGAVAVVPLQVAAHPVVHADVEVRHHEHRGLQALGEIERLHRHVEALLRIRRIQADVPRVAVRGVGARHEVALLRAGRHAGGGPDALDIEDHRRHLGVVRQPEEFVHERDARTGSCSEGARAVPHRADHHADGRQLILRLDERKVLAAASPGRRACDRRTP